MAWNTDEFGTRRFTDPSAPGWELVIWPSQVDQIDVVTGRNETDVSVGSDGIGVFGEESNSYTCSAVRFTIPMVIVREIVRFRDSVQSHGSRDGTDT